MGNRLGSVDLVQTCSAGGLSKSGSCDCGVEQTASHITSGCCPIYRPPEGINGIIDLDKNRRAWLENYALDI